MSFKLIAIRPLKGMGIKFIKNLKHDEIYNFHNDFKLVNQNGEKIQSNEKVFTISHTKTVPYNLYNIVNKRGVIEVSISAIVGKNGSGKSSLVDILLHSIFVVAKNLNLIDKKNIIPNKFTNSDLYQIELNRYNKDLEDIEHDFNAEIYYLLDEVYFKLTIHSGNCTFESISYTNYKEGFKEVNISSNDFNFFRSFFYTMVVNYSLYGYNSNNNIIYNSFFHKNDGYQTPAVITPFRNEGNIDINVETFLTRSRLLSNILSIPKYRNINNKSSIEKIELYLDENKYLEFLPNSESRFTSEFIEKFRTYILEPLFENLFKKSSKYPSIHNNINKVAEIYLINKLIKIPTRYQAFQDFDKRIDKTKEIPDNYQLDLKDAISYVNKLSNDRSHITVKVRQLLNFLREDIYGLQAQDGSFATFEIETVVKKISLLRKKSWFTEVIDLLPPPIYFSRIKFEDGSIFDDLSSGEKQKIYTLNSVIYHLRNLDSINNNKLRLNDTSSIAYQSINLIFDEIELYYHPQFQKETVLSLLEFIKNAKFKYIKSINIIFLTHSPFILSDIPTQNTVLLSAGDDGETSKSINHQSQSFGANILELLENSFFLTGSMIGSLAERSIMQLIDRIETKKTTQEDELLLNLIGDTFLKGSLTKFREIHGKNSNK